MVLTQIFNENKVPIQEDELKKVLGHTDIYNLATLKRMGFHNFNNMWTRKTEQYEC